MRALVQRVKEAKVTVNEKICGQIAHGMLLFLGVHKDDTPSQVERLIKKIVNFRIFKDENGKMQHDIKQAQGNILVVSQFTLYGECFNGNRPDFKQAALPEPAFLLYEEFIQELSKELKQNVQTGIFGATMEVSLINDGPVTFLLEC